jgi:transcription elongation factor GreA
MNTPLLTRTEFDHAVAQLHALRALHREDVAGRLRRARDFGFNADHDDQLAALEDAVVEEAKIKQLERLIASATVIADADARDGAAGLGSTVVVEDHDGRRAEYRLVGVRAIDAASNHITPGSPVGQALLGARVGDTVRVLPPSGRERSLTVTAVTRVPADARA